MFAERKSCRQVHNWQAQCKYHSSSYR